MSLSSSQLEAFSVVAKTGSFSNAAKILHVTQSALSQRIQNLERELGTDLLIRDPAGVRLTSIGEELLRYCHVRESLEAEFLSKVTTSQNTLGGVLRVAGFSSVMRSIIMPSLDRLVVDNPMLNIELFTRELRELPRMLFHNEVDLIVTTDKPARHGIISHFLGFEENALVESARKGQSKSDIYLDHDPDDATTSDFFTLNGQSSDKLQRSYLDEVYAIIDAVKLGWGRAVLPKHLVRGEKGLRSVKGYKSLKVPVMLQYFHQPFYSKLQTTAIEEILAHAPQCLA